MKRLVRFMCAKASNLELQQCQADLCRQDEEAQGTFKIRSCISTRSGAQTRCVECLHPQTVLFLKFSTDAKAQARKAREYLPTGGSAHY